MHCNFETGRLPDYNHDEKYLRCTITCGCMPPWRTPHSQTLTLVICRFDGAGDPGFRAGRQLPIVRIRNDVWYRD